MRNEILKSLDEKLKASLTRYYVSGMNIWASKKAEGLVYDTTSNGMNYHVEVKWLE